ncbi:hypothetical protein ZIOFF_009626 [Zingiber officinale]|uniref:Aldehyde dehydrogenase domain-containing protein n=1 Tax=Zingiber officinale TaxID=94328 RepID=A0A8J5HHL2_ZINOF|nr:hypothetical protein ZIOFF_009626 [Zingiber officinale]
MLPSHEADFLPELPNLATISFEEGYTQLLGDSNLMLHGDDRTVHLSLDQGIGAAFASQDLYIHGFFSASIRLPSDYVAGVVVAFYIDEEQFSKILRYIKSGINSGAMLVTGGDRIGNKGYYIQPTIFSDVQIDLRILKVVALEHPNDIDVAAESILVEILPSIATSHESSFTLQDANEVVRVSTSAPPITTDNVGCALPTPPSLCSNAGDARANAGHRDSSCGLATQPIPCFCPSLQPRALCDLGGHEFGEVFVFCGVFLISGSNPILQHFDFSSDPCREVKLYAVD